MALLVEFTELALQNRPELAEAPPYLQSTTRVRVLRLGDLEDVRALETEGDKTT